MNTQRCRDYAFCFREIGCRAADTHCRQTVTLLTWPWQQSGARKHDTGLICNYLRRRTLEIAGIAVWICSGDDGGTQNLQIYMGAT